MDSVDSYEFLSCLSSKRSIRDIEIFLADSFDDILKVKFYSNKQSTHKEMIETFKEMDTFTHPLKINSCELGFLTWVKNRNFTAAEKEQCSSASETTKYLISGIINVQNKESNTLQWESIYDSLPLPLCLVDSNFKIILPNKSFLNLSKRKDSKDAIEAFFGTNSVAFKKTEQGTLYAQIQSEDDSTESILCKRIVDSKIKKNQWLLSVEAPYINSEIKSAFLKNKQEEVNLIILGVAHELKSPLSASHSFLQIFKQENSENSSIQGLVKKIEKQINSTLEFLDTTMILSQKSRD